LGSLHWEVLGGEDRDLTLLDSVVAGWADQNPMDYTPFGRELPLSAEAKTTPEGYTGKPLDLTFGLQAMNYGARFYDPRLGRWWQRDPLAEMYTEWGSYVFAKDSPVVYTDPDGNSDIRFDGEALEALLHAENGDLLARAPMSNNVSSKIGHGKIEDGTYEVIGDTYAKHRAASATSKDNTNESHPSGSIGPTGTLLLSIPYLDTQHEYHLKNAPPVGSPGSTGIGVHAGREGRTDGAGRKGWQHTTLGCFRTEQDFMQLVMDLRTIDPVRTFTVVNNKNPFIGPLREDGGR
jgi:RHS repeat-associated protein